MNILGIHCGHSGSVALVKNGRLVTALALERITRKKHDYGINEQLIKRVLEYNGLTISDINRLIRL